MEKVDGEQWHKDFQHFTENCRQGKNVSNEFEEQQVIYSKYAKQYDQLMDCDAEQYKGYLIIANKMAALFPKDLRVLDFGCGTGLLGESLAKLGFTNVDGADANEESCEVARSKKDIFENVYVSRGTDGLDENNGLYDIICSSGTFFLTSSHPGTECFKPLLKFLKPGGALMILTKETYLSYDYVDWEAVRSLERFGLIKSVETDLVPGYRKVFAFEEDRKSMAALLHYQKQ